MKLLRTFFYNEKKTCKIFMDDKHGKINQASTKWSIMTEKVFFF